uniref:Uncharacterized protein n=1 Tax=Mycena chlorophos TaxID=658473 RepID=A0ABQ0KU78_MYCCL|nr:predicted protein [Mycena chlorophos]
MDYEWPNSLVAPPTRNNKPRALNETLEEAVAQRRRIRVPVFRGVGSPVEWCPGWDRFCLSRSSSIAASSVTSESLEAAATVTPPTPGYCPCLSPSAFEHDLRMKLEEDCIRKLELVQSRDKKAQIQQQAHNQTMEVANAFLHYIGSTSIPDSAGTNIELSQYCTMTSLDAIPHLEGLRRQLDELSKLQIAAQQAIYAAQDGEILGIESAIRLAEHEAERGMAAAASIEEPQASTSDEQRDWESAVWLEVVPPTTNNSVPDSDDHQSLIWTTRRTEASPPQEDGPEDDSELKDEREELEQDRPTLAEQVQNASSPGMRERRPRAPPILLAVAAPLRQSRFGRSTARQGAVGDVTIAVKAFKEGRWTRTRNICR